MKFRGLRKFMGTTLIDVAKYLRVDVSKAFSDLFEGLHHISIEDNFDHFYADVSLASGEEIKIPNRLGTTDLKWIVARARGDSRLIEGAPFTVDYVYIKNASTTATTALILFLR